VGLSADEKEEFFTFLDSLANSTYNNFQHIKHTPRTDGILQKLNIRPANYMQLIYNLTEDMTYRKGIEKKVRNSNSQDYIKVTQVLTEHGICYTTNNMLAVNLSSSFMIANKVGPVDEDYIASGKKVYDVRFGNLFDGDMSYSFFGFNSGIIIYMHSPYEIMNIARSIAFTNEAFEFEVTSIEIVTTEDFRQDTFISQRGCRFHHDSNLTHFKVYTKMLCHSECRIGRFSDD
jgi:acid-sensing ion channel, other